MEVLEITNKYIAGLKINTALSFEQYFDLTESCVNTESTTGNEITPARVHATKLNLQRMNRLIKTTKLLPEWDVIDTKKSSEMHWIVLAEAWCGDGAQIIPVMHLIAEKLHIKMDILLRDENPDIADKYKFRESRSIPRLICFDTHTGEELGIWGPRPAGAQEIVDNAIRDGIAHDDWVLLVQNWYNQNKTVSLQNELFLFVNNCLN